MTHNKPDTLLDECIFIAEKIIPADLCDLIVQDIETRPWNPHQWYNVNTNSSHSEETMELDVQAATPELQKELGNFVIEAGRHYQQNYGFYGSGERGGAQIMNQFNPIRFNRYSPGQIMRQHHDHIHSIFDGQNKGIPVLLSLIHI